MSDQFFQENGYKLLKGLIDPTNLFLYMQERVKKGQGIIDRQVAGTRVFYKDKKFEELMVNLLPTIETEAGCKLYKTYSYARDYVEGNELKRHRDRNACEISVTIALGHEGQPWPIWIEDKNNNPQVFILEPGDGLMFKGIQHTHWREINTFGPCSQVFLHYVDQNGSYAAYRNDSKGIERFTVPLLAVLSFLRIKLSGLRKAVK